MIRLGPFALEARIGRGGMGDVWRGIHVAQGAPVAVKVVTAERARDRRYADLFRREVRAVAGLDHPGIVMVFDHGEVGAEAADDSGGALPGGSPYLAMELAGRGTLREVRSVGWNRLQAMLLSLLDALAHAHARGVVHRDLKPSNVLLFGVGDPAHELKLADFGLAFTTAPDEPREADLASGTPHYMAPEQIVGAWRDYGPWTDLYALACVTCELVNGEPPFVGHDVLQAKLRGAPIPFEPRMPVPPGLEAWIRRALVADTGARFRTAADAARSLRLVPALEHDDAASLVLADVHTDPDLGHVAGVVDVADLPTSHLVKPPRVFRSAPRPEPTVGPELAPRGAPALPATWERESWQGGTLRLVGAGLGLYGLRSIPLVDRRPERDRLWRALVEARETGRPRLVILRGVAGCGKTRLAEWIAERAHEVGGALSLVAVHGPTMGPGDGLPRMLARHRDASASATPRRRSDSRACCGDRGSTGRASGTRWRSCCLPAAKGAAAR